MTFNLPYKTDPHAMHMYNVMGQNLALFINIFLAFLNPHNLLSVEAYILLVAFLLFDPKVLTLICQAFLSQGIHGKNNNKNICS